ncbi:hypothetical protein GIB67_013717 [Kingdonia uniflora]|uniref:Uncharacterized protein n=1 Tax=Kingdonia uniflora TaxID=39325 RepID=A0A7J7NQ01_9MAGN|nr:hypothetical protein GIB67_013717 [Kingdonia uniflora]
MSSCVLFYQLGSYVLVWYSRDLVLEYCVSVLWRLIWFGCCDGWLLFICIRIVYHSLWQVAILCARC